MSKRVDTMSCNLIRLDVRTLGKTYYEGEVIRLDEARELVACLEGQRSIERVRHIWGFCMW
jgi:hypothetical protein